MKVVEYNSTGNTATSSKYRLNCTLWKLTIVILLFGMRMTFHIYIERITPDVAFWDSIASKAELFFRECILPQVLRKVFSKPFSTTTLTSFEE
jgi:hypothetical protein